MADSQIEEPQADGIVRANLKRDITNAATFGSYYTNDIQIQTGPWDVRLIFGQVTAVDSAHSRALVEQVAEVRMSPQLAKRVVTLLQKQLQNYEAKIGPIPVPPEP